MLNSNDLSKISEAISKYNAKTVLIQAPEGLKTKIQDISKKIEEFRVNTIILAEPCFGACDIPDRIAEELKCDLIVHIGHSTLDLTSKVPVVYIELKLDLDYDFILDKLDNDYKNIGLVTTIQYIDFLDEIKEKLEERGKNVFIGKSKIAKYPGQLLGCDQSTVESIKNKVDVFLYVGSGSFHPLGVARKTQKPVLVADIERQEVKLLDDVFDGYKKKIVLKQTLFNEAKNIGLIVSIKKGQLNKDIFDLKEKIEKQGKKVWIVVMDQITPEKLLGMNFDILVNTACPRIEEDLILQKPIINWFDLVL